MCPGYTQTDTHTHTHTHTQTMSKLLHPTRHSVTWGVIMLDSTMKFCMGRDYHKKKNTYIYGWPLRYSVILFTLCLQGQINMTSPNLTRKSDTHENFEGSMRRSLPKCTERFEDQQQSRKYQCLSCNTSYKTRQGLFWHNESKHSNKIFSCQECGKSLSSKLTLRLHTKHVHENIERLVRCTFPQCTKSYPDGRQLMKHKVAVHGLPMPHNCDECQKSFYTNKELIEHKKLHSNILSYKCGQCTSAFAYKANLIRHIRLVHEKKAKKYSCRFCSQTFSLKHNMERHAKRRHTDEKAFTCQKCRKSFAEEYELRGHIDRHRGKVLGKCQRCKKSFKSYRGLKLHINRTHAEQKLSKCNLCQQEFFRKQAMEHHVRQFHSNHKDVKCLHCPATFSSYRTYQLHMRACYTRKTKKCKLCDSKFANSESLRQHAKDSHGITFKCDSCSAVFKQRRVLKKHVKLKHTNDYHECKKCKKRCVTRISLAEHTKNTHRKGSDVFQCKICPFKTGFQPRLKGHITKKHLQDKETKGPDEYPINILLNAIVE